MRMFLFASIVTIIIEGCNAHGQNSQQNYKRTFASVATVPPDISNLKLDRDEAIQMHDEYQGGNAAHYVEVKFSANELRQILDSTHADSVKFFITRFRSNPRRARDQARRGRLVILLQTRSSQATGYNLQNGNTAMKKSHSGGAMAVPKKYFFSDYEYFAPNSICPPPDTPPCSLEQD